MVPATHPSHPTPLPPSCMAPPTITHLQAVRAFQEIGFGCDAVTVVLTSSPPP